MSFRAPSEREGRRNLLFPAGRYCFCPAVNTVQGPAFMSRSSGFCHANSGC